MIYQPLCDNLNNQNDNYLFPFLWLHGEPFELVKKQLHLIHDAGMRCVCLESRTHPNFCEEKWFDDLRLILDECRTLGMKAYILDDRHFPSGYANGAYTEKYAHLRPMGITEYHIDVAGGMGPCFFSAHGLLKEGEKIIGAACALYYAYNDVYHTPEDISECIHDCRIRLDLPQGLWRVFIFVSTPHCASMDIFSKYGDKLLKEATDAYIETVYEPHYQNLADYFGNTLIGFFTDEPCFGNNTSKTFAPQLGTFGTVLPWSDEVHMRLKELHGEHLFEHMIALWAKIRLYETDIRFDYMNVVSDIFRDNYTNVIADWCHAHGVEYIGHFIEDNHADALTGYGAGHYFKAHGKMDMAGCDIVLHQLMRGTIGSNNPSFVSYEHVNSRFFNYVVPKLAVSLANLDPGKQHRALCEAFGAYGFAEGARMMKYIADHLMVRGINRFVPHAFTAKPDDDDCPPTFFGDGINPLYPYMCDVFKYMNRVIHMLENTTPVVPVAILYDAECRWTTDDLLPIELIAEKLFNTRIDYDIIPYDRIEEVADRYEVILLAESHYYPKPLLDTVARLGDKVRLVVRRYYEYRMGLIRTKIEITDGLTCDLRLAQYAPKPKCPFICITALSTNLHKMLSEEVDCKRRMYFLRERHVKKDGLDIYFITNEHAWRLYDECFHFPGFNGGWVTIYDAYENTATRVFCRDNFLPYIIRPLESVFFIIGDHDRDELPLFYDDAIMRVLHQYPLYRNPTFKIDIRPAGETEFKPYAVTDTLFDMTDEEHDPFFTGDIRYEFDVDVIDDFPRVRIDLGYVGEAVEMYFNGVGPFRKCFTPYRFDVTDCVHKGKNHVVCIVSNHLGYKKQDAFSSYMPFEQSGLLGPIDILFEENYALFGYENNVTDTKKKEASK